MEPSKSTTLSKLINWLKNNKFIAYALVFGIAVIGIGQFTEALTKINKAVLSVIKISEKSSRNNANSQKITIISPTNREKIQIEIRILSPKDGDVIFPSSRETIPAKRPIKGHIIGFTKDDIKRLKLWVEVSIKTDKWYPQGISRVRNDGTWMLRQAYFGGATHIIKATLKDKSGNEIASTTATVTLVS